MEETKKMLRSILVSSPLTISVIKLNNDYKELVGVNIPFKELGYDCLLTFLHAIPDVLRVEGNTLQSPVNLIVSKKTEHVNAMVLKQKISKKSGGGFYGPSKKKAALPPRLARSRNMKELFSKQSNQRPILQQNIEPMKTPTPNCLPLRPLKQGTLSQYQNSRNSNHNNTSYLNNSYNSNYSHSSNDLNINNSSQSIPQKKNCQNHNSKTSPNCSGKNYANTKMKDPLQLDLKLLNSGEVKLKSEGFSKEDTHYLRKIDFKNGKLPALSSCEGRTSNSYENALDTEMRVSNREKLLKKDSIDLMRQLLLHKEDLGGRTLHLDKYKELKATEYKNNEEEYFQVPSIIQDNLKHLISEFPMGIWCSQLPIEYRRLFKQELDYDELGFRCLINMCMYLDNIFHSSKESSCDFKLYDVRRPVPEDRIFQDLGYKNLSMMSNNPDDTAVPNLDWNSYQDLIPKDAVPLGVEIERDFVNDGTRVEDRYNVVVAEIYDLSKFWIYKDTGELDSLMDDMQSFYQKNSQKYLVPKYLLEVGLYCVVVTLKEFHRALIVSIPPNDNFVKVYFIDYGSLGVAPINEIWFLRDCYSKLEAQAIRTRLSDIFPPVENCTWSTDAIQRFRELASMKHVEAQVYKIIPNKNIIEVVLNYRYSPDTKSINNILADEGHALITSKTRKKCIEDPHCIPKVKFVHLFPTFEEIECWMVPSVEEQNKFLETDISADFFFPQYFTKPIDEFQIDEIERKTKKLLKRKEKFIKYIDMKNLDQICDAHHIHKAQYGEMYEVFKKELEEREEQEQHNIVEKEENCDTVDDYESFLNKLRCKRLNKNNLSRDVDRRTKENKIGKKQANLSINSDFENLSSNDFDVREFYGIVEPKKKEISGVAKHTNRIDGLNSLSELERYLSAEEDVSSKDNCSSPNTSKLIDLDEGFFNSFENSNFKSSESNSGFTNYRKDCLSFRSDSSSSDIDKSLILDKPINLIYSNKIMKSSSVSSDLIQLDVVLDTPILMPEIVCNSYTGNKRDPVVLNGNESDADDESESGCRLNFKIPEFTAKVEKMMNPSKTVHVQTDEVEFNPSNIDATSKVSNVPYVQNCSSVSSSSDVHNAGVHENSSKVADAIVSRISNDVYNSDCIESVNDDCPKVTVRRSPPGFGADPMYTCPTYGGSKYTVYQPWATGDCLGVNPQMFGFPMPDVMNVPVNNINLMQQQFMTQVSSFYRSPPIVVFNYNVMPQAQNVKYPESAQQMKASNVGDHAKPME